MSLDLLIASGAYQRMRHAALQKTLTWRQIADWLADACADHPAQPAAIVVDLRRERCLQGVRVSAAIQARHHAKGPETKFWQADNLDQELEKLFGRHVRTTVRVDARPTTQVRDSA